ncbi:MAG: nucleotide exchange factor GrpE [Pseudomarimonas sp.]
MQTNDWSSSEAEVVPTDAIDNLETAKARIDELLAALVAQREEQLRERAELDNQRKRMARDVEQARKFANERVLGDLLPVLDALERGLDAAIVDPAKMREGSELTLRQLAKVVDDHGLQVVDPLGQTFDPEKHQAMSLVDAPGKPADSVVMVMQKGYLLNGRLLRPALVAVTKS